MYKITFTALLSVAMLFSLQSVAQTEKGHEGHNHESHETEEGHEGHNHGAEEHGHGKHKVSLYTGFTHIPNAFYSHETHEESTGKWVPTLGLDYWYTASKNFDFGAIIDTELDEYYINIEHEDEAERELERNNVIVLAAVAKYKPCHGLGIFLGPGIEWEFAEETKEFFVIKAGIEYEIAIDKGWEITPSFSYDFKEEYSAYSYGFSIGKRF